MEIKEGSNLIGWIIVPENSHIVDVMGIEAHDSNPFVPIVKEIKIRKMLYSSDIPYLDKPILDEPRIAEREFYKCADLTARHCVEMARPYYQGKIYIEFLVERNNRNYKIVAKAYTEGEDMNAS